MPRTTTKLFPGITQFHGGMMECCFYLVEGSKRALLIDSGLGVGDLPAEIAALTSLPYDVFCTHGHGDHVGAVSRFPEAFCSEAELPELANRLEMSRRFLSPADWASLQACPDCRIIPVAEGHRFELGGKTLEVIATPGHSIGCLCLLDIEDRVLFCGDCVVSVMDVLLTVSSALTVSEYCASLEKLVRRSGEFDFLCTGHDLAPLPVQHLHDCFSCAKEIVDGTAQTQEIKVLPDFGSEPALRAVHGLASIQYRAEAIR